MIYNYDKLKLFGVYSMAILYVTCIIYTIQVTHIHIHFK